MELDFASKASTVTKMIANWSENDPSQPFTALSGAQQTVLTDRSFHYGARLDRTAASDFYAEALAGDWKAAALALPQMSNYQTYRSRIDQNIKLLNGGH
jgi:GH24 family phage-related lysozyme (muramidase)